MSQVNYWDPSDECVRHDDGDGSTIRLHTDEAVWAFDNDINFNLACYDESPSLTQLVNGFFLIPKKSGTHPDMYSKHLCLLVSSQESVNHSPQIISNEYINSERVNKVGVFGGFTSSISMLIESRMVTVAFIIIAFFSVIVGLSRLYFQNYIGSVSVFFGAVLFLLLAFVSSKLDKQIGNKHHTQ